MSYYKIEKYEKMDASIVRGTFRATLFTGGKRKVKMPPRLR